jgi:hypothetical protein
VPDYSTLNDEITILKSKIDGLTSQTLTAEDIMYVAESLTILAESLGVKDIVGATAAAVTAIEDATDAAIVVINGTANGAAVSTLQTAYNTLQASYNNLAPRTTSLESQINSQSSAIATASAQAAAASFNPWQQITGTSYQAFAKDRLMVVPVANQVITLPPGPITGDVVEIIDIAGTAGTTNFTVNRSGEKIQGLAENLVFNVNSRHIKLLYTNSTYGWRILQ